MHVCKETMSLPLTCPITHASVGCATSTSLTLYSYVRPERSLYTTMSPFFSSSRL